MQRSRPLPQRHGRSDSRRVAEKREYRKGPYDASGAERDLIRLIYDKEIKIDERGRIWRIGDRYNHGKDLYPCPPRRAEHRTRDGYLEFRSMYGGRRRYVQAHRLVWQYFYGEIPAGQTINHINGIVDDNRPTNLELATMAEQITHSVKIGRRDASGENNNNAALTADEVEQIRILHRSGMLQKYIARQFAVSKSQISRIVRGESWG